MKRFAMMMLGLCSLMANAQSISLRAGKTFTPADYLSIRYDHWSNHPIQFSLGSFIERSHHHNLQYAAFGFDLLMSCRTNPDGYRSGAFGYKGSVGLNWQVEHEPWLYKDWPFAKRASFGLTGELTGSWYLSEAFTLHSYLQQKMLFNSLLGRSRFLIGLGIDYQLGR